MMFSFDATRTFLEVVEPDADGYGRLTISMLDPERTLPMLRYQTGDIVRMVDRTQALALARRHGVALAADLPPAIVALRGRDKDALPNGSHVGFYKDALYADRDAARQLSGAFRVIFSSGRCTMHVQLAASQTPSDRLEETLLQALPPPMRPERLAIWPYATFPFGMGLDYERKFSHYVSGEGRENAAASEPLLEACTP
jgi:phenylacetate-CoA ligase